MLDMRGFFGNLSRQSVAVFFNGFGVFMLGGSVKRLEKITDVFFLFSVGDRSYRKLKELFVFLKRLVITRRVLKKPIDNFAVKVAVGFGRAFFKLPDVDFGELERMTREMAKNGEIKPNGGRRYRRYSLP